MPLALVVLVVGVVLWGEHVYRISGITAKGKLTRKGVVEGLELSSSKEGKLSWMLRSSTAHVKGSTFLLEGVEITYNYAPGKTIVVRGKYGEVDQKRQTGRLWGEITVAMGKEVLTTSELIWDMNRNKVSTDQDFKLEGRYLVEGKGFDLFLSKGKVEVRHLRKAVIF
jgi:hypothetical protein